MLEENEADGNAGHGKPFPVVGIGASAGGLEAFGQLLEALPADTGLLIPPTSIRD